MGVTLVECDDKQYLVNANPNQVLMDTFSKFAVKQYGFIEVPLGILDYDDFIAEVIQKKHPSPSLDAKIRMKTRPGLEIFTRTDEDVDLSDMDIISNNDFEDVFSQYDLEGIDVSKRNTLILDHYKANWRNLKFICYFQNHSRYRQLREDYESFLPNICPVESERKEILRDWDINFNDSMNEAMRHTQIMAKETRDMHSAGVNWIDTDKTRYFG